MTNKLTDEQIKKALECCINGNHLKSQVEICEPCPYFLEGNCTDLLKQYALDLINRLETKNSNLQEKNSNLTSDLTSLQKDLTSAKAEVERLKNAYKQCAWERDTFQEELKTAKAEAYKEFANELKCRTHEISYNTMQVVNKDDIDNLLNELVG